MMAKTTKIPQIKLRRLAKYMGLNPGLGCLYLERDDTGKWWLCGCVSGEDWLASPFEELKKAFTPEAAMSAFESQFIAGSKWWE